MLDTKPILAAIFQDDHEALKTMLKTLEPNVGSSFAEIDAVSTESGDANRCYNLIFCCHIQTIRWDAKACRC